MCDLKARIVSGVTLSGEKTRLEPFGQKHLQDPVYLNWLHDRDVIRTLYLRDYLAKPVSFEEVAKYVQRLMVSETDMFLALHDRRDGRFVGTLKAGHIDWDASIVDIGIMIGDKNAWGRGLATDSLLILCRFLFEDMGFRRLTAGAMGINMAMVRVFKNLGFQQEGTFRQQDRVDGEYCDHIYLGCFAAELKPATDTKSHSP
jgi:[ribosomal protein S5]-alanine N-acetyltransferase